MSRDEVLTILSKNNRDYGQVVMYTDLFLSYQAATKNIQENGDIVVHPRTGAPIDNPYSRVRNQAITMMSKMKINASPLWLAVEAQEKS